MCNLVSDICAAAWLCNVFLNVSERFVKSVRGSRYWESRRGAQQLNDVLFALLPGSVLIGVSLQALWLRNAVCPEREDPVTSCLRVRQPVHTKAGSVRPHVDELPSTHHSTRDQTSRITQNQVPSCFGSTSSTSPHHQNVESIHPPNAPLPLHIFQHNLSRLRYNLHTLPTHRLLAVRFQHHTHDRS